MKTNSKGKFYVTNIDPHPCEVCTNRLQIKTKKENYLILIFLLLQI